MQKTERVEISAPNMQVAVFGIVGTAPYVQQRFSAKAQEQIKATQEEGPTSKKGKKREPKDFKKCYEQAMYETRQGWHGIPASAFRNAMVSACRLVGYQMTRAKLAVFIEADGFDDGDSTPLVRIVKGSPEYKEDHVRNANGTVDLRARAMWRPGWEAKVKVRYDADQMTLSDITHLLARVGMQVGLGEGRPDSKQSCGQGWGLFEMRKGGEKK